MSGPAGRSGIDRDQPTRRAAVKDVEQVQISVHEPVIVGAGGQFAC